MFDVETGKNPAADVDVVDQRYLLPLAQPVDMGINDHLCCHWHNQ